MNISKIGMNSTTFGIDPRQTYKGDIEVQDLPEIKRTNIQPSTVKAEEPTNDVFISKRKPIDNYLKYTFKKDKLIRNANDFIQRGDVVYTGQTDFILPKNEQKMQLLKDMEKEDKIKYFEITDNKRFGKGISFRLITAELPDRVMAPTLIEVRRFGLTFDRKKKETDNIEIINITDGTFKDFCKTAVLKTDKLGQVFFISENK